jgi:hypothetical protein
MMTTLPLNMLDRRFVRVDVVRLLRIFRKEFIDIQSIDDFGGNIIRTVLFNQRKYEETVGFEIIVRKRNEMSPMIDSLIERRLSRMESLVNECTTIAGRDRV